MISKVFQHNKKDQAIRQILIYLALLGVLSITGCSAKRVGMVAIATAHPLATQAGFEILQKGGNVFDAAVAISATLAVVEPSGSGLGGGGFWLLHRERDGLDVMLDGREKAPLATTKNMYLNANGKVQRSNSLNGALAAGIPGMPAAIVHLSERYGRLSLADNLQPAIRIAEQGFLIGERHRKLLAFRQKVLLNDPATAAIFLDNGNIPTKGTRLRQANLGQTLRKIATEGRSGFYQGSVAQSLVNSVKHHGGIWSLEDLLSYQVIEREPITSTYKNIKITSASLPSSGGIVLSEALNILETIDLNAVDKLTRKHLIVEAMRRAYHDRALYLGDSDFVNVPVKRLLDKNYAHGLASTIRQDTALPSVFMSGQADTKQGGRNTTHFSIIDEQGNRVAATLSINYPFGAGLIAGDTGVLLNDEMDDFVSAANSQNGYGLVGGVANEIAAGKRMLSSMTPTFLEDKTRIAVLGTPGGSRIISMVLLAAFDFSEGHNPTSWVNVKRFHHQYIPDQILYEKNGLTANEIQQLHALGHQLKQHYHYGNMQAVQLNKENKHLFAASDPRGEGEARVQ